MGNTYNDGTFTYKKASNILSSITDNILINSSLNDFTVGSALRTLSEAESLELEELYYLTVENMTKSIDDAVLQAFGFERKTATYAYGNILLTFSKELTVPITIPKGTTFFSTDTLYTNEYETLDEYVINTGSSSITFPVYCKSLGTGGNIPSGTINVTTDLSGISSITNPTAFQTGTDDEDLEDLKQRFRNMLLSLARGTVSALKYAALSIDGITGVDTFEDTYGVVVVYCNDANGDLNPELQSKVTEVLEQYRSAGINIIVRPTNKSMVDLRISLDMNNKDLETPEFLDLVKSNIEVYINSFGVGKGLYINDIVQKVMDISDLGISDCSLSLNITPNYSINQDSLSDSSILKVGGSTVNQHDLTPIDFTSDTNYGLTGSQNTTSIAHNDTEQGNTWKDAELVTDDDGNNYYNPISVLTRYITQSNEVLKSSNITVYFNDDNDYTDYNNYGDTNSIDTLITG